MVVGGAGGSCTPLTHAPATAQPNASTHAASAANAPSTPSTCYTPNPPQFEPYAIPIVTG